MANEIIKVYDTEVNALANGTTGRINPLNPATQGAIGNIGGIISNIGYGVGTIPFYIYKKFYYRFEANEPVVEFHIDWDDGEDNSPKKANIEIIKLDTPEHSVVTSHIYTEHKHFFPLVRVKSIGGFLSKWYTSDEVTNDYSGLESTTLSAGQNDFSVVSEEKAESDRISSFLPSNLPPIGVLKADKKRIYSGIDNDAILSTYAYPLLYAYSTSTASTKPDVVFTMQDDNGATRKHTLAGTGIWNASSVWRAPVGSEDNDTYSNAIPAGNLKTQHTMEVSKILVKSGTTANDFTTDGSNYMDIHYDTIGLAPDINENSHTRIYLLGSSGDDEEGGYGQPSNYSAWKIFMDSANSAQAVIDKIRHAFNTTATNLNWPLEHTAITTDGNGDVHFTFTNILGGNGTKTDISDNVSDTYLITSTPTQGGDAIITDTGKIKKLLRVELDNAKELSDTDRIYIKVFDANATTLAGLALITDNTLAVLSNGSPIVDLSSDTIVYLDGAESRTRASNLSISTYNFDDDKLNKGAAVQAADADGISDLMSGTFSTTSSKKVSYSFSNIGDGLFDSDNRFRSTYRLPRLQVKDDMVDSTTANASDALTYSAIEHFEHNTYKGSAIFQPSDLESRGLLLFCNTANQGNTTLTWHDVSERNINDTQEILGSPSISADGTYTLRRTANLTDHPLNHLFIAKTDKFDRLFFRMDNNYDTTQLFPNIAITAYYGDGTTWVPLEIIDETQGLKTSGSIKFTTPSDWYKGIYTDIDGGDWIGPIDETDAADTDGPEQLWTSGNFPSGAYGLLISIATENNASSNEQRNIKCMNVWPYNNSHSQLIKIVDSNHVSLNSIAIAQSISFGRTSKTISVEDKFGKADIRKIGASGGGVTFGGIDLGESEDHRKTMVGYQKNGTPVFLDVSHKSGDITRFFGVISRLSEDHPAGLMYPKWAVTMQIGHILELSSTGAINSDKISIGGALVDDGQYIL